MIYCFNAASVKGDLQKLQTKKQKRAPKYKKIKM